MFILKQHLSLVLALIFAVLASVGLYRFLENRESVAHAEPTAVMMGSVVVAKHDLAMGSRLTEENMVIQSWPKEVISERNFSSLEPLVGRTLRSNLIADEPIMSGKILKAGENISSLIPPNMRAVTIQIHRSDMLSRILEKGSVVDVISAEGGARSETRVIADSARVLLVEQLSVIKGEKLPTLMEAVVLVTSREAENVVFAASRGPVDVVVKSRDVPILWVS